MINIIDDIMGSGKTTYIFNKMNRYPLKKYLCVVPLLDECQRYLKSMNMPVFEPQEYGSKFQDFKRLVAEGRNIVTTHSLISNMDKETMGEIQCQDYTLIIDEALEVLCPYDISKSDINLIFDQQLVSVDDKGYLQWNSMKNDYTGKFNEVKKLCKNKALMTYKKEDGVPARLLMWNFPVDFFKCFEDSYILTYMWDGSIQKAYFGIHGITYEKYMLDANNKKLIPHDKELEMIKRAKVANLINICSNKKYNKIGERTGRSHPLSKSWYSQKVKELNNNKILGRNVVTDIDMIKNNTKNFFRNCGGKAIDNMYTCHSAYSQLLAGNGYRHKGNNKTFVPCNACGTNDYSHKKNLAYLLNFFLPSDIENFINHYEYEFDNDQYALSSLLQWIWRSQIRNGKPIKVYIPSERMRTLLIDWIKETEGFCKNIEAV